MYFYITFYSIYIFVGDVAHPAWHVNSELVDESLQNGPEKESGLM